MDLSILLPVHNEARLLPRTLPSMVRQMRETGISFEIVICENGSTDGTWETLRRLDSLYPEIRALRIHSPGQGTALRHAAAVSKADALAVFSADFWSVEFVRRALKKLSEHDLVIGSKVMKGAQDRRPLIRRLLTRGRNRVLRFCFGFRGTDTTGLKAFRRTSVLPLLAGSITRQFGLETELVLRAQRKGLKICEIPVQVSELRPHSFFSLAARIPGVLWNLSKLWFALRCA